MGWRLLGVGAVAWLGAHVAFSPAPAGVQSCTTDCQTAFTDCMQACDGEAACQARCRQAVERCISQCTKPRPAPSAPPTDAGISSDAGAGSDAGDAGGSRDAGARPRDGGTRKR